MCGFQLTRLASHDFTKEFFFIHILRQDILHLLVHKFFFFFGHYSPQSMGSFLILFIFFLCLFPSQFLLMFLFVLRSYPHLLKLHGTSDRSIIFHHDHDFCILRMYLQIILIKDLFLEFSDFFLLRIVIVPVFTRENIHL